MKIEKKNLISLIIILTVFSSGCTQEGGNATVNDTLPLSYHIEVPLYSDETASLCYLISAMMLLDNYGFSDEEIQNYKELVLSAGQGGPPDICIGFKDFGLSENIRMGYSSDYDIQAAEVYNSFLKNPESQVITFDTQESAFEYLKLLISSDIPVEVIIEYGNHHVVVTGYDEQYVYINDPNPELEGPRTMPIEQFLDEWVLSGDTNEGVRFPGDWSMLWLEKNGTIAPSNSTSSICQRISAQNERYFCLGITNHDDDICRQIDMAGDRNACLALANQDPSYCDMNEEESAKEFCFYELADMTRNISLCSELEDSEKCYFSLVTILHWESDEEYIKTEYCDQITESNVDKDICLGLKEMDESICEGNPNCLTYFEQELSFCTEHEFDDNMCMIYRALSSQNSTICEEIDDVETRDKCYDDFSSHIGLDPELCEKIIDSAVRDMCYAEVAIALSE